MGWALPIQPSILKTNDLIRFTGGPTGTGTYTIGRAPNYTQILRQPVEISKPTDGIPSLKRMLEKLLW